MSATLSTPKTTSGGEIITHLINSTDGAGLHFDGVDGTVALAAPPPNLGTKFSFELVIQADSLSGGDQYLVDYGSGGRFLFGVNGVTDQLGVYSVSGWGVSGGVNGFGVLLLDDLKVHHLVVTVDGTVAILYNNGNQVGTAVITSPNIDSAGQARIGSNYLSNNEFFNGTIYRARLWNKTLEQADVTSVYESASLDFADQWGSQTNKINVAVDQYWGTNQADSGNDVTDRATFNTNYVWTINGTVTDISVASNVLQFTTATVYHGIYYPSALTANKRYRVTLKTGAITGDGFKVFQYGGALIEIGTLAASTTNIFEFTTPANSNTNLLVYGSNADGDSGAGTIQIDAASVPNSIVEIGCVSDFDFSYANPTQSDIVRNRNDTVTADGTAAGGVVQITKIEAVNTNKLSVGGTTPLVGIGLAAGVTPASLLHISGTAASTNQLRVTSTDATATVRTYSTSDGTGLIINQNYAVGGSPYLRNADFVASMAGIEATQMRFFTKAASANPAVALTIDSTGNVGIGTPSPNYALEVSSAVSTVAALRVPSGGGSNDKRLEIATGGDRVIFKSYTDSSDAAAAITFQNGTTEAVRIDSTGNVGIGESDPGRMLTVAQATTPTDFSDPILWVGGNGGADSYAANNKHAIGFHYVSSGTRNPSAAIGLTTTTTTGSTKGDLLFATRDVTTDTAPTTRLTISSSGLATFSAGIAFSSQTESTAGTPAASSVLNHYETGIFTPVPWDNDATQMTTSIQLGSYIRVGKIVYCTFNFKRNDTATLTNTLYIRGLPFVFSNNVQTKNIGIGSSWLPSDSEAGLNYGLENTSSFIVQKNNASGYILSSDLSNLTDCYGALTYEADV